MSLTFWITFSILIIAAIIGSRKTDLPKNIWLLLVAMPLNMCIAPMAVLAGSLLAAKLAPEPSLATLPLALTIVGTAAGAIPASAAMKRFGRRIGTLFGQGIAVLGALLISYSAVIASFSGVLIGCLMIGFNMAFTAQMRFAAIESVDTEDHRPRAVATLMTGGIFAAIMGPEAAVSAAEWIPSPHGYAGSFLALAILITLSMFIVSQLDPIEVTESENQPKGRPLKEIMLQPMFLIAVSSGAIAYAVMSYIMTASPLNMHEVIGHDLNSTKEVVQSHIIGMYLPSLFTAWLVAKLGLMRLMALGWLLYVSVIMIAFSGHEYMHYWWLMVTLGVGWNFLFTAGTLTLPKTYRPEERFKTQAVNDFTIFIFQAVASLSAGAVLFSQGWDRLISLAIPFILLLTLVVFAFSRLRPDEAQQ